MNDNKFYGVQQMDKEIIQKYLNYSDGFYIEVGGNNGIFQSNTAHLEFQKNWSGILIEALPHKYDEMKVNRPNSICYNSCLSDIEDKEITFYDVNLMSFVQNSRKSEDADLEWISEGEKCQNIEKNILSLKTKRLESILSENNVEKIDFFSLDVEGHELQVLIGLNITKNRPKYILIETTHKDEIFDFMSQNNYTQIDKFVIHDYLFKDNLQ
jgi:FkbM family methyltransferase